MKYSVIILIISIAVARLLYIWWMETKVIKEYKKELHATLCLLLWIDESTTEEAEIKKLNQRFREKYKDSGVDIDYILKRNYDNITCF